LAIRIGLPRGLLYYQYGSIWERFLQELGAEVVVTGDTSKATLNCGSGLDEVCLPAKVYFGHIYELYKQVDYLFTPRIISVAAGQYTCPKIIGMPDMLRSNIDNLPPLIDVNLNLRQNSRSLYQAIITVGHMLGKNAISSLYAWYHAWQYRRMDQAIRYSKPNGQRIGLIGHPYIIYDRQISMNIIDKLNHFGIHVITPEMVSNRQAAIAAKTLGKKIFWSNGDHMAGAALALIQSRQPVDGLIFITSFTCGPDALIGELVNQRAQALNIPCMLLTVDEHTAEAGFVTRLEAFTDMLIRRKQS
jgi:predicted nucleotide-binding protein (sugar kinase/HSP70/actin superfamily)